MLRSGKQRTEKKDAARGESAFAPPENRETDCGQNIIKIKKALERQTKKETQYG